jgi:uncharacterized caspase-like protein
VTRHHVRPAERRRLLAGACLIAGLGSLPAWPWLRAARAAPADPAPGGDATAGNSRIALVIGNGAYRTGALRNPVGDARAVADRLKALGFAVTLRENTGLRDLLEAFREFSVRAPSHAVRLVFYAGHGIQVRGRNFLVPVDMHAESEDEIPAKSADVGQLIDRLAAIRHGMNIVILDACRANPFAGGVFVDPEGRRVRFRGSTPAGLARLDAPAGTLIAYSTAPGGVAFDGPAGKQSVYARHLLTQLESAGMPIETVFKRVRVGVAQETAQQQVPWESSSLMSDFCFRPRNDGRCG